MISQLELSVDTTKDMVGIILEEIIPAPNPGEYLRLYIPELMSVIKRGSPSTHYAKTKGEQVFINAPDCKPKTKSIIKGQNYITVSMENNSFWENVPNSKLFLEDGSFIYKTNPGQKVIAHSMTGKLSKMTFHTNGYIR